MSRIGLKIIEIPDDVTVNQESNKIIAKGKNGELSVEIHQSIVCKIENNIINFSTGSNNKNVRAFS